MPVWKPSGTPRSTCDGSIAENSSRHAGYGVQEAHYATVGEALVWTLARGLGASFTPETQAAWVATYEALAGAMQRGAQRKAA